MNWLGHVPVAHVGKMPHTQLGSDNLNGITAWEENVKIHLVGTGRGIHLAQDRAQWRALVNAATKDGCLLGCYAVFSSLVETDRRFTGAYCRNLKHETAINLQFRLGIRYLSFTRKQGT
jgi:hypothetical protein